MKQIGFDHQRYLQTQSEQIRRRIAEFGGKLYLEFGGKLFDDTHAARVLPGFLPDSKLQMLLQLKDQAEIVIVINAGAIASSKVRGDLGITYEEDVLRLVDSFRSVGLYVGSVTLTCFEGQPAAAAFQARLEQLGMRVYRHYVIEGYPSQVERIVSDEGYGKNDYIETTRQLVVVTAPGPGSGKMATCLSQLYHDYRRGVRAGYAKFETFPIWNLPLKHPVNLAYEAATADLNDVNMIDPFHLEAYGKTAVNYNRDVEIFPVVSAMLERIAGHSPYASPTDMGVNMAGECIVNDEVVCRAAKDEIIRRYYAGQVALKTGKGDEKQLRKLELLMKQAGLTPADRPVVGAAAEKAAATGEPAVAIELPDGRLVTGKTSALMGAASAALLNALKALGNIDDDIHLLSPVILQPIQHLKVDHLGNRNPRLHTDEILLALAIGAATNPTAEFAMQQLGALRGCQVHASVILSSVDRKTFQRLGMELTMEPAYQTKRFFHA